MMNRLPIKESLIAMALVVTNAQAVTILVDYNDGTAGGGHDLAVNDGDFSIATDGTPAPWINVGTGSAQFLTNNSSGVGSNKNFAITLDRKLAIDTGHTIQAGDSFDLSYMWRDAANWDLTDSIDLILYYTDDNTVDGSTDDISAVNDLIVLNSGNRTGRGTWETESMNGNTFVDAGATGKTLFARFEAKSSQGEFSRIDNLFIEVTPVPEPSSTALLGLAGLGLLVRRSR